MPIDFEVVIDVDAPPRLVFDLALDIDAHLASMASSGETAVGGVTEGLIGLGEEVTWRARHFGVVWTMTSRVTEFDAPRRFVDEQVRGPFKTFRHVHLFNEIPGGTRMTDQVAFTAPLGPLGRIAEVVALGRYLPRLIRERSEFLRQAAQNTK